ncbi:MAG: prepilin-type N-terminal cleavage/methylation domain-containing protein [Candidatus Omnitrophota bacterium]
MMINYRGRQACPLQHIHKKENLMKLNSQAQTDNRKPITATGRAFTLIEMLVVLALIMMVLGISIPFFANFAKGEKIKTAAKDIATVLNSARNFSITERKNYAVVFDYSASPAAYYIVDEANQIYGKKYVLPSPIKFYHPQEPAHPTTFPSDRAVFSSTGGLKTATGSVWLADQKGQTRRVTVSQTTGRVSIDTEP